LFKPLTGADPGFQVRGAHLKNYRRAEGGAKMFEVFRVKHTINQRGKIITILYLFIFSFRIYYCYTIFIKRLSNKTITLSAVQNT
jgi:hypothetical protein